MSSSNGNANGRGAGAGDGTDGRAMSALELPLMVLPSSHPCHGCGECCRYVATEIDEATAFKDHENVVWYLVHRDVSVYIDWEGDWYLEFKTVCEHLTDQAACGIYEDRPEICSEFSWDECEKTTQERAYKFRFTTPDEYHAWHAKQRPKSYARYMKRREKLLAKRRAEKEASAQAAAQLAGAAQTDRKALARPEA